jgi:hypothetical protein
LAVLEADLGAVHHLILIRFRFTAVDFLEVDFLEEATLVPAMEAVLLSITHITDLDTVLLVPFLDNNMTKKPSTRLFLYYS